jgi:hypothetical protein
MWLFDTCSLINLSYCSPIAAVFKARYNGTAGWVKAVQAELVDQRAKRPPHPQAGKAVNWASSWLGAAIVLDDDGDAEAVEEIRVAVSAGGGTSELDHLGEAASIRALLKYGPTWGSCRLISDDRGARDEARRRNVAAASTVGVVAKLIALEPAPVPVANAELYLGTLRKRRRMHVELSVDDLLANVLGSWE